MQIYNEKIFDLLQTNNNNNNNNYNNYNSKGLQVHESKTGGLFVDGLSEF